MVVSGQTTGGHWVAVLIGAVLLFTVAATTIAGLMHAYWVRRIETALQPADELSDLLLPGMGASLWRCQTLIAEAIVVRQRLSGQIDVETYQVRMTELARQANSERRPQHNT